MDIFAVLLYLPTFNKNESRGGVLKELNPKWYFLEWVRDAKVRELGRYSIL